jgi:hypothetical protein
MAEYQVSNIGSGPEAEHPPIGVGTWGFGSASTMTLAEARAERDRWRKVLTEGRDPIEARAARHAPGSPQALTSGKVVEDVAASASDRLGSLWPVRNAVREVGSKHEYGLL